MQLNNLPKIIRRRGKRVGRGIGSGKGGHTSSRGQKGQKSRGQKVGIEFFGTKMKKSILKRIPMLRGKGKFKPGVAPVAVKLRRLNSLPKGAEITLATLVEYKVIRRAEVARGVKIVGGGEIERAMVVRLQTSVEAKKRIEKAGGKVEEV